MTESVTERQLAGRASELASAKPTQGATRAILQTAHFRVLLIDLEPGRELPPHRPEIDLVLAILEGTGELLADDRIRAVRAGDLAIVRAGVARGLRCPEGRLLALGVVTPPPGPGDHRDLEVVSWPEEPATEDPADVIRAEHQRLLAGLEDLRRLADAAGTLDTARLRAQVETTLAFLQGELLPHATAEERLVYPAVERVLRARGGATHSMELDHRRIEKLTSDLARAASAEMNRSDATRLLQALAAVVGLHFDKEEEDYLPHLARLGRAEKQALVLSLRGGHDPGKG
ncbi:MAG: hemerythrin domain-containing protein [Candidatus Dormibacteria bacterium]